MLLVLADGKAAFILTVGSPGRTSGSITVEGISLPATDVASSMLGVTCDCETHGALRRGRVGRWNSENDKGGCTVAEPDTGTSHANTLDDASTSAGIRNEAGVAPSPSSLSYDIEINGQTPEQAIASVPLGIPHFEADRSGGESVFE